LLNPVDEDQSFLERFAKIFFSGYPTNFYLPNNKWELQKNGLVNEIFYHIFKFVIFKITSFSS